LNRQYEKEKSERVDSQMKSLETLRVNDSDEYTSVKIKLEIDIQVLEQQLQQVIYYQILIKYKIY